MTKDHIEEAFSTERALKLALEALESCGTNYGYNGANQYFDEGEVDNAITAIKQALAAPVQEPVKFLANGTRFKTSEFPYGVCINGLPKELSGRWVALVAAEDDCHLQLTTPPAAQPAPVQDTVAWNKKIMDSVDSLLAQAGFEPDSSVRHQLAMMNFDVNPASVLPEKWRNVLPGGRGTDQWESARVSDFNKGWNEYRKAAKAALEKLEAAPPAAQRQWIGLTDDEKRGVCRVGPVYAPDGVVTRTPLEYRKELEGVALMAVRQAEAKLKEKNGMQTQLGAEQIRHQVPQTEPLHLRMHAMRKKHLCNTERNQMKIEIYTKPNCPNCVTAKALLTARGLEYNEYDVEAEAWSLKALLEGHPEARQMPQIFIDDQRVGGFAGLQAALRQLGL